jgi:hypothetical protein
MLSYFSRSIPIYKASFVPTTPDLERRIESLKKTKEEFEKYMKERKERNARKTAVWYKKLMETKKDDDFFDVAFDDYNEWELVSFEEKEDDDSDDSHKNKHEKDWDSIIDAYCGSDDEEEDEKICGSHIKRLEKAVDTFAQSLAEAAAFVPSTVEAVTCRRDEIVSVTTDAFDVFHDSVEVKTVNNGNVSLFEYIAPFRFVLTHSILYKSLPFSHFLIIELLLLDVQLAYEQKVLLESKFNAVKVKVKSQFFL